MKARFLSTAELELKEAMEFYETAREGLGAEFLAEVLQRMLQTFLADRFKMKIHFDEIETPQLALVVGKGGPKLKPADPDKPTGSMGTGMPGTLREIHANGLTMDRLAKLLSVNRKVGRLVVNRTNLAGGYDFKLSWSESDDIPGASIFTALQEQLGLRLETVKAPQRIIVIDSAERPILQ